MGAYDDYKGEDLEAELKARDLPHSGTNAEKIARLEEDDAAADSESSTGDVVAEPGEAPGVYAGEELADPDRPYSAENPIKRALVNRDD